MGKGLVGDFIGFTFNNIHSSTLGITRVSNGDRYNEDLLPAFQDKVVDTPGTDGTYYFGSYFKQRPINIQFAFDDLNEMQFRRLKQIFSDKEIHELWFDETPYKAYNVKISGTPNIKYICFDKQFGNSSPIRIYKGEGTLSFIAYYPFAHSRFKYLNDYNSAISNKLQWLQSSGIRIKGDLDVPKQLTPGKREIKLWNGGDLETDFKINILFNGASRLTSGSISIEQKMLKMDTIKKIGKDDGIQIDTKLHLIQGFSTKSGTLKLTGNLYNKYINSGDFFKIPIGSSTMKLSGLYNSTGEEKLDIDYQYLYI